MLLISSTLSNPDERVIDDALRITRYFVTPERRATTLVIEDLGAAYRVLIRLLIPNLTHYQKVALICLISDVLLGYATAPTRLETSFLVGYLRKGQMQLAASEFCTFCYRDKKVDSRALQKRQVEQQFFTNGKMLFP